MVFGKSKIKAKNLKHKFWTRQNNSFFSMNNETEKILMNVHFICAHHITKHSSGSYRSSENQQEFHLFTQIKFTLRMKDRFVQRIKTNRSFISICLNVIRFFFSHWKSNFEMNIKPNEEKKSINSFLKKNFYLFSDYKMRIFSSEWGNEIQEKKRTQKQKNKTLFHQNQNQKHTQKHWLFKWKIWKQKTKLIHFSFLSCFR